MCNVHATLEQSLNPDHSPGELHSAHTCANAHVDIDTRCDGDRYAGERIVGDGGSVGYTQDPIDSVAPGGHVSGAPHRHTLHSFGRK
jgi:hypothetical protein